MNRHIVVYIFTALLVLFASCGKHAVKDTGKIPIDIRKSTLGRKRLMLKPRRTSLTVMVGGENTLMKAILG